MTKIFDPPISSRATEELISIKHSTTDLWQQEAIDQAKNELKLRKVTVKQEQEILKEWQAVIESIAIEEEERLKENDRKEYQTLEMLEILFAAPFILAGKWKAGMSLLELRKDNYKKKFDERLILLICGIIGWALFITIFVV
ncbi:MAG TPA: hypothetical protein VF691_10530 [Cytophagaceae bacterium]|jgi:hypothetical protein